MLLVAFQLLIGSACFSYRATVSIGGTGDSLAPPPASRIDQAADAVARSVEALGLIPDPRVERIIQDSRESRVTESVVVGLYKTEADRDYWIEVWLLVEKRTGKFSVLIEDRQSPFSSPLIREIEAAVVGTLEREFPTREIRHEDGVVGPSLGP